MRRLAPLFGLLLTACAYVPPKPIVDLQAVSDPQAYQKDLIECVTLADYYLVSEINSTMTILREGAWGGAGAGVSAAALGATSGSISGDVAAGFVGGAIAAALAEPGYRELLRNRGTGRCLENRGYEIVNARALLLHPRGWCAVVCQAAGECTWDTKKVDECVPGEEKRQERLRAEREARKSKNVEGQASK